LVLLMANQAEIRKVLAEGNVRNYASFPVITASKLVGSGFAFEISIKIDLSGVEYTRKSTDDKMLSSTN
jgi:hypothetical protein